MKFAIIDATAPPPVQPLCSTSASRYATPIANVPLIHHVCEELAAADVREAAIVATSQTGRDLAGIVSLLAPDMTVSYRFADTQPPRQAVLAELERGLSQGSVLLHPGDSLFRGQVAAMCQRLEAGDVDAVLPAQAPMESLLDPAGRRASEAPVVLGADTRPLVEDLLAPENRGDDLIASLLHSDYRLAVCDQTEGWTYSEATDALLAANRLVLDALPARVAADGFSENNRLHGRVSIAPTAFVSNCVIRGPASIADGAVLEDSFIGPFTAVGPHAVVSGAEIDNTMVLSGAEIRHPGARIEASIIGERARVTRAFELPSGLHLRLGPDAQITLS